MMPRSNHDKTFPLAADMGICAICVKFALDLRNLRWKFCWLCTDGTAIKWTISSLYYMWWWYKGIGLHSERSNGCNSLRQVDQSATWQFASIVLRHLATDLKLIHQHYVCDLRSFHLLCCYVKDGNLNQAAVAMSTLCTTIIRRASKSLQR